MRKIIFILIILFFPVASYSEESVYDVIGKISIFKDSYHVFPSKTGIDIKSKETFKNIEGTIEPVTHMELEGPLKDTGVETLEQGMDILTKVIKSEVDKNYEAKNSIIPGLSASIVDVNGTKVGVFNYKMNNEPNTYVERAVLLSKKGLYSFTMVMHQSEPNSKKGLHFMVVIIAAVNSGKL